MQGNNTGQEKGSKQSGLLWTQPANTSQSQTSGGTAAKPAAPAPAPTAKSTAAGGTPVPRSLTDTGNTPRYVSIFATGIIVGGLLAWALSSLVSDTTSNVLTATSTSTSTSSTSKETQNASSGGTGITGGQVPSGEGGTTVAGAGETLTLSVLDQAAAMEVHIANATVSKPTWVAIYDSENGAPGKALGATMFFPEHNGKAGVVFLLRPTVSGKTYFVGGRVDNGDHRFDPAQDAAIVDASGSRLWKQFNVL